MALTREQHNRIMRIYDERRRKSDMELERREEELGLKLPEAERLSERIAINAVRETGARLKNDSASAASISRETEGLIAKKKELMRSAGYPEDYLSPHYECELCEDTGYIGSEKCRCFKKLEAEVIYLNSGIPSMLKRENFENFDLEIFDDEEVLKELAPNLTITQRGYMEDIVCPKVRGFLRGFEENGEGNLLMTGPAGTGKTFLSNCIAGEAIKQCRSLIYESSAELFDRLSKDNFSREKDEELSGRVKEIYDCELLVIDDLGTELTSSFTNSSFFMLLSHRLRLGRSTIISSNLSLNQMSKVYGERIVSRLMESFILIPFYGMDLRLKGGMRR